MSIKILFLSTKYWRANILIISDVYYIILRTKRDFYHHLQIKMTWGIVSRNKVRGIASQHQLLNNANTASETCLFTHGNTNSTKERILTTPNSYYHTIYQINSPVFLVLQFYPKSTIYEQKNSLFLHLFESFWLSYSNRRHIFIPSSNYLGEND